MRTRDAITALGLAAGLAGCGFHQPPDLTVADLRLRVSEDGGAVMAMVIEATNYGDDPLPLGEASYELSIAGEPAFAGRWRANVTAPARGSIRFELPAPIDAARLPAGATVAYGARGTIEYVPPGALGEALFDTRIRRGAARFAERGELRVGADEDVETVPASPGE